MISNPFEFWFVFIFTTLSTPFFVLCLFHPMFEIDPLEIRTVEEREHLERQNRKAYWGFYLGIALMSAILQILIEFTQPGGLLG